MEKLWLYRKQDVEIHLHRRMVHSHRTNRPTEAVFDNVAVRGTLPRRNFQDPQTQDGGKARDPRLDKFDRLGEKLRWERKKLVFAKRKELIAVNIHSMPSLTSVIERFRVYEKRPFNGFVLVLQGGRRPFKRRAWNENRFIADYEALSSLRTTRENFILLQTASTMDWFNDKQWESVLRNTRIMAKYALLGPCARLFGDPEGYGANPRSYYDAIGKEKKSFEEFGSATARMLSTSPSTVMRIHRRQCRRKQQDRTTISSSRMTTYRFI